MGKSNIKHKELVKRILDISYRHKLSHLGSCLTALPIIMEIYQQKKDQEKFILSAGHAHLAHLVVMEKYYRGDSTGLVRFDAEEMLTQYGIHCDRRAGCDCSSGSLGQGLPIAVGMALADRSKNVYCLISDGECSEGSIWEARNIIKEQKIRNIFVYLNYNGWGAYRKINFTQVEPIIWGIDRDKTLDEIDKDFFVQGRSRFTQDILNNFPFLKGQDAHYKVMNEEEYKEALEVLR